MRANKKRWENQSAKQSNVKLTQERTLHFGCKHGERETADENGDEDVDDDTDGCVTLEKERRTEAERQSVGSVDDEEKAAQADTVNERGLQVNLVTFLDMTVIQSSERCLGTKGLSRTNCGDDFFSHSSTLRNVISRRPEKEST